jgi:serine/threonine-protein phosphatase PPG1
VDDLGNRVFNVFDASPDNDLHQAQQQQQQGKEVTTEYFL